MRRWLAAFLRRIADWLHPLPQTAAGELLVVNNSVRRLPTPVQAASPSIPVVLSDMFVRSQVRTSTSIIADAVSPRLSYYGKGREHKTVVEGFQPVRPK